MSATRRRPWLPPALMLLGWIAVPPLAGCRDDPESLFIGAHGSIRPGMSVDQVFEAGLADYLARSGIKNAPGSTRADRQPASAACRRFVVDVAHRDGYRVTLYCDRNAPGSTVLRASGPLDSKASLIGALRGPFRERMGNLEFRVESPPRAVGGVYDHFRFTTGGEGLVDGLSPITSATETLTAPASSPARRGAW